MTKKWDAGRNNFFSRPLSISKAGMWLMFVRLVSCNMEIIDLSFLKHSVCYWIRPAVCAWLHAFTSTPDPIEWTNMFLHLPHNVWINGFMTLSCSIFELYGSYFSWYHSCYLIGYFMWEDAYRAFSSNGQNGGTIRAMLNPARPFPLFVHPN